MRAEFRLVKITHSDVVKLRSLSLISIAAAGVAHRLHGKHGKNVVLLGEGCQAVRVGGYAHGIVFSAKELKADELFEVNRQPVSHLMLSFEESSVCSLHCCCSFKLSTFESVAGEITLQQHTIPLI